jgi:ParB family transcriptional regulator, chromosome partitioning protein
MKQQEIVSIPISEILVTNPRRRNRKKWLEIVTSIRAVGLKRPITVSRRSEPTADGKSFDLVCGQGRIEAFIHLGETTIPAIITDCSREDQLLMSLVENLARRAPSNFDILREVTALRQRGYIAEDIAQKLGLDPFYSYGLVHLVERGEGSLVHHVEAGRLPITVAVEIARGDDHAVSIALSDAYQSGLLRGAKLTVVRKLIAARISKQQSEGHVSQDNTRLTPNGLARIYEDTVQAQRTLLARAEKTNNRMLLLVSTLRQLFADQKFVDLLRNENLSDMPVALAQRLR